MDWELEGRMASKTFGALVTTAVTCLLEIATVLAYLRLTRRPASR
jgi:hypothetical protein